MFIYIAHAEADKADAEELQTFLKKRGLVVHIEDGARGFHHLQQSDVVIALWSQKSVFGSYRIQLERRMLDAWADQRLVLVRLGHAIMPVGLRDLPFIDASFANGRDLAVWPQVERAAREAINRALVERPAEEQTRDGFAAGSGAAPPSPPAASRARAPGAVDKKGSGPARSERVVPPAKARGGSGLPAVGFILAMGCFAWLAWAFYQGEASPLPFWASAAIGGAGGFIVLVMLLVAIVSAASHKRDAAKPASPAKRKRAEIAPAPAASPAPAPPAAEPAPAALFISYSHADNAAVEPVVRAVQENGRIVWIDKTGIQTGDEWAGEIVRAIKSAKGIMVMCSKHAFESDHVKREVYLADRYKKPLSPVFIEDAKPPEDFEYFFASVQWLELWKLPEAERRAAIGKALEAV